MDQDFINPESVFSFPPKPCLELCTHGRLGNSKHKRKGKGKERIGKGGWGEEAAKREGLK